MKANIANSNVELSELTKSRRAHIESCEKNNDQSHKTIANLYSDPSHFIYELLQNADDAKATKIEFSLKSDKFIITHNGTKLFDFSDVDLITGVGESKKSHDINQIGKFGIGFKSVFAVTESPHIHSGDFHFHIVDFIVPEEIAPLDTAQEDTRIILPFNNPQILPEDAYEKTAKNVRELKAESLLFLRNLKEIQWKTESENGHYISDTEGNKANILSVTNEEELLTEHLVFSKTIAINKSKLDITIAYEQNADKTIMPVQNNLFVFFPTKIITRLPFFVHVPYKTTPNRETIPFDDPENAKLTNELAQLIADSLLELKKNKLLTVELLSWLPINRGECTTEQPIYCSAFDAVRSALKTKALLPTENKGYANAINSILAREQYLTQWIDKDDCITLFNKQYWLSTDISYDKTKTIALYKYLNEEIEIPIINVETFCKRITKEFMEAKSDE